MRKRFFPAKDDLNDVPRKTPVEKKFYYLTTPILNTYHSVEHKESGKVLRVTATRVIQSPN